MTSPWTDPASLRKLGRVAVLAGGRSAEREVSLRSGAAVHAALQRSGVESVLIDPANNIFGQLQSGSPDRAFVALHGRGGEDGSMQGLLEVLQIPYSGSGVLASALAMDKWRSKQIWWQQGLPTPQACAISPGADLAGLRGLGLPLFVKPAHEGSSIGMSRVDDLAALESAVAEAARYDDAVLVERFVDGAEYTVAILDGEALPVLKLETDRGFYDYTAKYEANDTRYLHPSGLSSSEVSEISELSMAAFRSLGCSGWGRVDVMRDASGAFQLLEVNTVPGLTDHSLVPMAAGHAGISFDELVLRILFAGEVRDVD